MRNYAKRVNVNKHRGLGTWREQRKGVEDENTRDGRQYEANA